MRVCPRTCRLSPITTYSSQNRWLYAHNRLPRDWHIATAFPFIYSFSGNSATSAPIPTFICLWAIYIFPGSVHIFHPAEKAEPMWEYIILSQTHKCGNWDWDPDIPFLGMFFSNFRHFVFAVQTFTNNNICLSEQVNIRLTQFARGLADFHS